jgi:hypothetical protein
MSNSTARYIQGLLNSVDKVRGKRAPGLLSKIHALLTELSQSEEVHFDDWLFDLSREFFVLSKPLATMVLSSAVEMVLFFMEPIKILQQSRRSNPPALEELIWVELINRAQHGKLSLSSVWRIAINFRSDDLRREFLFWFSQKTNFCELATLLSIRSGLALGQRNESSDHPELAIIDEAIKLRIVSSTDEEIRRLCAQLIAKPIPMLPVYLWPMCRNLFPLLP